MTISIRIGTFETNSSSVHSFVYIPPEIAERWRDGKILIHFLDAGDENIAEDIDDRDVVELSHVNGSGIYPDDPFSYQGYFPYRMFVDEELEQMWKDSGTLDWCDINEEYDGSIIASVSYMG